MEIKFKCQTADNTGSWGHETSFWSYLLISATEPKSKFADAGGSCGHEPERGASLAFELFTWWFVETRTRAKGDYIARNNQVLFKRDLSKNKSC